MEKKIHKWELQQKTEREKNKTANKIADLLVGLGYIDAKEILETSLTIVKNRAIVSQADSTMLFQILQEHHDTV